LSASSHGLEKPEKIAQMASYAPNETVAQPNYDNEKNVGTSPDVSDHGHDAAEGYDTDNSSHHKQGGVKRVEAITSVQTKKTLWIMFAL